MTDAAFASYLAARRGEVEAELERSVRKRPERPSRLARAMRYALLGGGKRLRPVLALAAAEAVGGAKARRRALRPGCAIEMIHAYSLAHDDLPSMDDDDMRRGCPSLHVKFDEATAILAGDALLTDAFSVATAGFPADQAGRGLAIAKEIAGAAGSAGMVAGQVRDLEAEGRKRVGLSAVQEIHRQKTGALLRASVRVGAIAAGASDGELRRLTRYGDSFGLLFQIADDILDEVGDLATLGKPGGGDRASGKATYPAVLGLQGAREEARRVAERGSRVLRPFGRRAAALRRLLQHVADRAT